MMRGFMRDQECAKNVQNRGSKMYERVHEGSKYCREDPEECTSVKL